MHVNGKTKALIGALFAWATLGLADVASAQVVVEGDGRCPAGHRPLTLAEVERNRAGICRGLPQWHIVRLAGGASMDGPGYQCQTRPSDDRRLGHTLCVAGAPQPPPQPPSQMMVQPGVYQGVHPHWRDTVLIFPDGTYRRGNGDPGRWYVEGPFLVLDWQNWGAERLQIQPNGSYRAPSNGFTITFQGAHQPAPRPLPVPQPALDPSALPGTYDATHPRWRGEIELVPNGSFTRNRRVEGRWHVEGMQLVLTWQRGRDVDRLTLQPDGILRSREGLTLERARRGGRRHR